MKGIPSSIYDKDYYLSTCLGSDEFKKSHGKLLHPSIEKHIQRINPKKSSIILDLGCGRGDITLALAKKCKKIIGVDYSKDAILIAQAITKSFPKSIQKKISFMKKNIKNLPFPDNYFDQIIAIDIFEHLYQKELDQVITEISRVLKKNGTLYVHTGTNKILNSITYPFYIYPMNKILTSIDQFIFNKKYNSLPKDPRTEEEKIQHVNEPTYWKLKNLFQNNSFQGKINIEIGYIKNQNSLKTKVYNFLIALYPFSKITPLSFLFAWVFICNVKNLKK